MKILVTGGAGFIGSHLVELLLEKNYEVAVLDDLTTGSLTNLDSVFGDERLSVFEGSVLDEYRVDRLVSQVDCIIHLAAAVGVKLVMDQPLDSFRTNVRGTENIVEAAERHNVKIMVASTSEVYGKNQAGVFSEDADFVYGSTSVTRWTYALSKATDEVMAYYYYLERGLSSIIFRLFNTVGPRQSADFGMVLPRFVRQAMANEPVTVFGSGQQSRCFCHVYDTVRAIVALLEEPDAIGGTFNIGSPEEISIVNAAKEIIRRTGSSSQIQYIPYEDAYGPGFEDIPRRVPDISKISALTTWSPTKSLDEILDAVINDVKTGLFA